MPGSRRLLAIPWFRRPIRMWVSTHRMSGRVSPRLTLNLGRAVRFAVLENDRHGREQCFSAAQVSPGRRLLRGVTVVRGSFGLFYDRVPLRALANALLSGGNTTVLSGSSQVSVSLSPGQTGAPVFPDILPSSAVPLGVLVNFTTIEPEHAECLLRARASLEIEHQIGENSALSFGYQQSARAASDRFDQPERGHLLGVGQQQWMPPESQLCEQQPVFVAG